MESARIGPLLRGWRHRRRLSQLDLALEAGVSARHVSFLETGRAKPSANMVLRLAERLDVPLRERNRLLLAAGYAPAYEERAIEDPQLDPVREAVHRVLDGHAPCPALAVDRGWNLVAANESAVGLMEGVAPHLQRPPVNVLRASLHPEGLAPAIVNLGEWRAHLLARLERQAALTGDAGLAELLDELRAYPAPAHDAVDDPAAEIALPLELRVGGQTLRFISTVTTFGAAADITVSELSIESFFPADAATSAWLSGGAEVSADAPGAAR